MLKAWIVLLLSFQRMHRVHSDDSSGADVCDYDDNDTAADACAMKRAFGGSSVFPQLLPDFSPKGALYVKYANVVVGGAQQLAPSRVISQPAVSLAVVDVQAITLGLNLLQKKFTLLGVDYDAQTKGVKPFWLQTGLVAAVNTGLLTSSVAALIPYSSPNPLSGTGTHEYVFLAFYENDPGLLGLLPNAVQLSVQLAQSFNLNTFLSENKLEANLVAGSFFKSTYAGQALNVQASPALNARDLEQAAASSADSLTNFTGLTGVADGVSESSTGTSNSTTDDLDAATAGASSVLASQNATTDSGSTANDNDQTLSSTVTSASNLVGGIVANSSAPRQNICVYEHDAAQDACDMILAFEGSSIIPQTVPAFQPLGGLYVQYGNVVLGGAQQMSPSRVAMLPTIKFSVGVTGYNTANKEYLLLLIDSLPSKAAVSVSWAQADVTIDASSGLVQIPKNTAPLCSYIKPDPPAGKATRNYIFLLYEQSSGFSIPVDLAATLKSINSKNHDRVTFELGSLTAKIGLASPVGSSFFKCSAFHPNSRRRSNH